MQPGTRELHQQLGQRGREQQRLPRLGQAVHDLVQLLLEAHLKQPATQTVFANQAEQGND